MNHIKFKRYYKSILTSTVLMLMFLIAASVAFGAADISIGDSYKVILSRIPVINNFVSTKNIKEVYADIILQIRLPRILLAAIAGMGLSSVGAVYQGIFKNPMADPYILGVSSGSALGAAAAIVLGLDTTIMAMSGPAVFAFISAILTTLVVYNIAKVGNRVPTVNLLLSGVAISFFLSSIISMIMIVDRNQVDRIIFWTLGSFAAASWQQVEFLALVCLPLIVVILFFARDINVILTDEETSKTLGVDSEKVKRIMLAISSLMVASIVSVSGIIGFVGLIIPHSIRLISGADNRRLIPLSAVVGAGFMIICDTLARSLLAPTEIPVGVVTSMFGAPYFIYLLYKNKKKVY